MCTGNSTEGSNPSLSAINFPPQCIRNEYIAVFVCRAVGKKWGKLEERNWTLFSSIGIIISTIMGDSTDYYNLAIKNIAEYGDTDIFPYPVENALFFDDPGKIKSLLEDIDKNFNTWLSNYPIEAIQTCVPVGYTGYRWATLIDPIWNAYFLAQVLKISEKLEEKRISIDKDTVYSYRINFGKDSGKIFNSEINWRKFYEKSALICEGFNYVVKFDISDFYNRIRNYVE